MTRTAAPRLTSYLAIAALFLLGGLATGRPELVALATPFIALLVVGLILARSPHPIEIGMKLTPDSVVEGEPLELTVDLTTSPGIRALELAVPAVRGLDFASGEPMLAVTLDDRVPRHVSIQLRAVHWGVHALGKMRTRTYDALHLFRFDGEADTGMVVRVYPRAETMRTLLRPRRTLALTGNRVARHKGDGIEFADLRPYGPGDRVRSINWRASARRGQLWVNERHPERNVDVVLFLDTFADAESDAGSVLDETIRGGAGLAAAWLGARDRVGLVSFGGILGWLEAGSGVRHAYRIVDALLRTRVVFSYAWKDIDVIPSRLLPPGALIVALSPMLDDRVIAALLDLRARGFDLVVVEIAPEPFLPPTRSETESLARRLWKLQREALRYRYARAGVPVVTWTTGTPLEVVMTEVEAWRRHQHLRAG